MASKTERTVINAAGLVQGIVLVTFPAASLSTIFGFTAIIAGAMALLSFFVCRANHPGKDDAAGLVRPDTDTRDRAKTPRGFQ
jgi:hypothetical protein